ncbi:phosphoenolpyruvate synthase [Corallincola platygyrae]|uniref:Phosphoenolpyruvate synthase n=1 Tax=Corallincola platygyrae TaxID=1193278 RepID=A0ABW4XIB6_9GAMM
MTYIRWFKDLTIEDIPLVGGKNASLGEMYDLLSDAETRLPNGFAITADAYRALLDHNDLRPEIERELATITPGDTQSLQRAGSHIRHSLKTAKFPPGLEQQLLAAYAALEQEYGSDVDVAVRSSATAEDLPDASFAGQQETFLNVHGAEQLLLCVRKVFASLFTDRAINYRDDKGFDHMEVALSIGIQKMVRSDLDCSGVMFTLDTESGFRDVVLITAAYGLGENVVQGAVNPDEYLVFKPTLNDSNRPIVRRHLGEKAIKMVYSDKVNDGVSTRNVLVSPAEQQRFALQDDDVLRLAKAAVLIEKHYSARAGKARPMDIEWAKDGLSGELFILQARPETVHASNGMTQVETYALKEHSDVLVTGKSVGKKIATGKVRIVLEASHMHELEAGEVLVTDITDPDWEPVMKIASAIVTNRGGRVCHAAIIARELGIPAIVGCGDAVDRLREGEMVTICCAEGDTGRVYQGALPFEVTTHDAEFKQRPKTQIMMNVADPHRALEFAALPNDGVGLARLEFIINHLIGIHPQALLEYAQQTEEVKAAIDEKVRGYPDPVSYYVERMAEGIGAIAAAFYPKKVILRFSDFKSNEYCALIGGERYEPKEENPMIGFRGAGRYPSDQFAACFALECQAVKKVRERMGLTNLTVMIPFTRTIGDLDQVMALMESHGLKRGENGLKVYTMCEIPANVILADKFLERCDGYSIGSNDLTQLTLGVDRDSGLLTQYDERDEAVLRMIEMAIKACNERGKYIGICGQAPSDFPQITRWLVEQGIGSISLNPDSMLEMTEVVLALENDQAQNQ